MFGICGNTWETETEDRPFFFLNRGKFSGPEEKSDAAAPCKNHQKSALYPFSRSSGALNINATTLYFWILIADIQSNLGFVSSVLSITASSSYVVIYVLLVYGMSLNNKN